MNNADCHSQNAKTFEIDFNDQLQRGISIILAEPNYSSLDTKIDPPLIHPTNLDQNNSEKTYDLSDLLLQGQKSSSTTTLTQLEPVRATTTPSATMIYSLNECSTDSHSSSFSNGSSMKRKLIESSESNTELKATPTKRGRKPSSVSDISQRNKFTKHEVVDPVNNETKTLVYFGNKRVALGTDEYDKRRKNNNEAVKKCREKAEKEQKEREERMNKLDNENKHLKEKLGSLTKEMEVLKGIIISMRPENKLPENIQHLLNEINQM